MQNAARSSAEPRSSSCLQVFPWMHQCLSVQKPINEGEEADGGEGVASAYSRWNSQRLQSGITECDRAFSEPPCDWDVLMRGSMLHVRASQLSHGQTCQTSGPCTHETPMRRSGEFVYEDGSSGEPVVASTKLTSWHWSVLGLTGLSGWCSCWLSSRLLRPLSILLSLCPVVLSITS